MAEFVRGDWGHLPMSPFANILTTMENPLLKKEFDHYLANQAEMVANFNGKFVVIKDAKVIGVYDDQVTAITETQKTHKVGTFLVQKVEPGTSAYTQTFHSRVAFR